MPNLLKLRTVKRKSSKASKHNWAYRRKTKDVKADLATLEKLEDLNEEL